MSYIFHNYFYLPLLNLLVAVVALIPGHNFGVAVVILTLIVNTVLLPLTHKMKHSQRKTQLLEPEMARIKKQYKDQREEQTKKIMELYREHGINPLTSFLFMLVQFPLLIMMYIGLYQVFIAFANGSAPTIDLYSFTPAIPSTDLMFLKIFDLSKSSAPLAFLAAFSQFLQARFLMPKNISTEPKRDDMMSIMQKQMQYTLPAVIFFIGLNLPSALALYWTTMSIFGIVHEGVVRKRAESLTSYGNNNGGTKKEGA